MSKAALKSSTAAPKVATSRFAHLASVPPAKKPAAAAAQPAAVAAAVEEDEERKKKDGETDEEYKKRMKALDDKEDEDVAEEDDEKEKAEAVAEGVALERERWSMVLSAPEAEGNVALACDLLCTPDGEVDLSAAQIVRIMQRSGGGKVAAANPLARRMAAADLPKPAIAAADGPKPGTDEAKVSDILAAAEKARGTVKKPA
jgi:hypothetical protein